MAVDTRSKRASVLGIAAAITLTLPLSDGTVGQPDRQHVACCYAGIEAAASTDVAATPDWTVRCAADDYTVVAWPDDLVIRVPPSDDTGVM